MTIDFLHALARNRKPLVAAVGGLAVGIGTTMLLHCDHVVAATDATFLDAVHETRPHSRSGIEPAGADAHGPCARLRHAGHGPAARPPTRRKAAGLVNTVVDAAAVEEAALQAAREIAALPPGAVALSRQLLRGDLDDVIERIDTEAMHFKERLQSDEARAAFAAFLARRK